MSGLPPAISFLAQTVIRLQLPVTELGSQNRNNEHIWRSCVMPFVIRIRIFMSQICREMTHSLNQCLRGCCCINSSVFPNTSVIFICHHEKCPYYSLFLGSVQSTLCTHPTPSQCPCLPPQAFPTLNLWLGGGRAVLGTCPHLAVPLI
jgi:hypothetical protein